jgi:hypothetical protein
MEVHHSHHHGQKKKIKEYFLEFLMLFIAVTLGFFAENLREKQIEQHREISYLKNVHEDLRLDFKRIDSVINTNSNRLRILDTMYQSIKDNSLTNEDAYYYIRNLVLRATFESSHIGFDQIKSAGGFRMIKDDAITSGIQEYETLLNSLEKLENVRERTLEQARFKMSNVFKPEINYEMMKNQSGNGAIRFNRPQKADDILKTHPKEVDELFNTITVGLNTNNYLNSTLKNLKSTGIKLDEAILKKFGNEISEANKH